MGDWRSWLARLTGSQKATGSNPVFSTKPTLEDFTLPMSVFLVSNTLLVMLIETLSNNIHLGVLKKKSEITHTFAELFATKNHFCLKEGQEKFYLYID